MRANESFESKNLSFQLEISYLPPLIVITYSNLIILVFIISKI